MTQSSVIQKKITTFASEFVQWCNGSTSDSGSACEGSNPSWTTFYWVIINKFLFINKFKLIIKNGNKD